MYLLLDQSLTIYADYRPCSSWGMNRFSMPYES